MVFNIHKMLAKASTTELSREPTTTATATTAASTTQTDGLPKGTQKSDDFITGTALHEHRPIQTPKPKPTAPHTGLQTTPVDSDPPTSKEVITLISELIRHSIENIENSIKEFRKFKQKPNPKDPFLTNCFDYHSSIHAHFILLFNGRVTHNTKDIAFVKKRLHTEETYQAILENLKLLDTDQNWEEKTTPVYRYAWLRILLNEVEGFVQTGRWKSIAAMQELKNFIEQEQAQAIKHTVQRMDKELQGEQDISPTKNLLLSYGGTYHSYPVIFFLNLVADFQTGKWSNPTPEKRKLLDGHIQKYIRHTPPEHSAWRALSTDFMSAEFIHFITRVLCLIPADAPEHNDPMFQFNISQRTQRVLADASTVLSTPTIDDSEDDAHPKGVILNALWLEGLFNIRIKSVEKSLFKAMQLIKSDDIDKASAEDIHWLPQFAAMTYVLRELYYAPLKKMGESVWDNFRP